MRISLFLFSISKISCSNFVKNFKKPECKKCIYYKPDEFYGLKLSPYNECSKFGEKDIINGNTKYDVAKDCRNNIDKCGIEGKYYEENDFYLVKQYYHLVKYYSSYLSYMLIPSTILYLYIIAKNMK